LTTAATASASTILAAALRGVTRATTRAGGAAGTSLQDTLSLYRRPRAASSVVEILQMLAHIC
jgi:hypothetical protein